MQYPTTFRYLRRRDTTFDVLLQGWRFKYKYPFTDIHQHSKQVLQQSKYSELEEFVKDFLILYVLVNLFVQAPVFGEYQTGYDCLISRKIPTLFV